MARPDSHSKLADLLLWVKDGFEHPKESAPVIPLTHQDLADLAGLSRETITRILNELETEKVVKLRPRHVELVNLAKLKNYTT